MYGNRLAEGGEEKLKVHCYRALLEKLLVARDPGLRHTQLRTVAQAHKMDFPSYVRQVNNIYIFIVARGPTSFLIGFFFYNKLL
jgi:hypothetical protein